MKWYFALNEGSLLVQRGLWQSLITAAVKSARRHTILQPHFIFDGPAEEPFLLQLQSLGVAIHRHRVTFHDALASHQSPNTAYARMAAGAFLRTELPLVETEDEVVLYTDCDVIFRCQPRTPNLSSHPFACAPEFDKRDYTLFNTGVMLMNLPALRSDLQEFTEFIKENLNEFVTFDQDAYRKFYGPRARRLPLTLNWKPYWGLNSGAEIIHFHGPKPNYIEHLMAHPHDRSEPTIFPLYNANARSYAAHLKHWYSELA